MFINHSGKKQKLLSTFDKAMLQILNQNWLDFINQTQNTQWNFLIVQTSYHLRLGQLPVGNSASGLTRTVCIHFQRTYVLIV
jgi:hypothetical protein